MKLYLLSQSDNRGYDTFDSVVVAAESEDLAATTHPCSLHTWGCVWADSVEGVTVTYLGEAVEGTPPGVILASFNAG